MLAGTLLALIYSDTYCGLHALLWTLTSAGYLLLWVARCYIKVAPFLMTCKDFLTKNELAVSFVTASLCTYSQSQIRKKLWWLLHTAVFS